ncbi:MAG: universal stress protein [Flaviramulus sp.]|nr:universal stress protein [Flaviramulus sp.]NNC49148.1 universal stress protein [Flaviramulus sp.]
MRKILIPTDFSDNALNALVYALELFKYDKSEFYIMHAYQDDIYADNSLLTRETLEEVTRIISNKSQLQLENILNHVNKVSPNPRHTYDIVSSSSNLIDETDKIVNEENIDIIVMGTRGKTNDKKITFGSHTLQVLRYVQCPVLAIPENYKHIQPRHILFPTNYMIPYKRRELKLLCEMAAPYRAVIEMLYISKSSKLSLRQEDNQSFIKAMLSKNKIKFVSVDNKSIINAIYTHIKENNIDMLVMVNTRHSFLENILFQSTIDKLSLYLDIPFLTLQNMRRF